ncbi:MAG: hypothetical protein BWY57_03525 [Betaproteobacteria bacterium ADurb.Bin341]|nr:MAG: hypothetical protein BWY57_03525 [Betaproteobacteria bacterium ADurb.Bin341]
MIDRVGVFAEYQHFPLLLTGYLLAGVVQNGVENVDQALGLGIVHREVELVHLVLHGLQELDVGLEIAEEVFFVEVRVQMIDLLVSDTLLILQAGDDLLQQSLLLVFLGRKDFVHQRAVDEQRAGFLGKFLHALVNADRMVQASCERAEGTFEAPDKESTHEREHVGLLRFVAVIGRVVLAGAIDGAMKTAVRPEIVADDAVVEFALLRGEAIELFHRRPDGRQRGDLLGVVGVPLEVEAVTADRDGLDHGPHAAGHFGGTLAERLFNFLVVLRFRQQGYLQLLERPADLFVFIDGLHVLQHEPDQPEDFAVHLEIRL